MFSKRDEVQELQETIGKKVSWQDHNHLINKLAELKKYLDTMANDIFIGHLDALRGEFYKKADKDAVEQALKLKADNDNVNEVRARLERLEVLVAHTDARQTVALEGIREELGKKLKEKGDMLMAKTNECMAAVGSLKADHLASVQRLADAEAGIQALASAAEQHRSVQEMHHRRLQEELLPAIAAMQEQLTKVGVANDQVEQDVRGLERDLGDFRETSEVTFANLSKQVGANKDHVEFLLQETDMIKRRSRETTKKQTSGFQELKDEQDKFTQQLVALEGNVKKQSVEARAIENRVCRAVSDDQTGGALASLRALALPALAPEAVDPNARLMAMMQQLEALANGGPSMPLNADRPPLPGTTGGQKGASTMLTQLPRGLTEQAPIDSARGAAVKGNYGLSPRVTPGGSGALKKNKYVR